MRRRKYEFNGAYRSVMHGDLRGPLRSDTRVRHKASTPAATRRLLTDLSFDELEPIAVEVIREHRRRLQRA